MSSAKKDIWKKKEGQIVSKGAGFLIIIGFFIFLCVVFGV